MNTANMPYRRYRRTRTTVYKTIENIELTTTSGDKKYRIVDGPCVFLGCSLNFSLDINDTFSHGNGWFTVAIVRGGSGVPSVLGLAAAQATAWQKYSLNQIAQDSTVHLINSACSKGVRIAEVYVDTVGMPEKYQAKLSAIFPELKITVAKKADATYPIVSAASICAKVSRDRALSVWKFTEGLELTAKEFGSGYPNDPVTKKFLIENIDPVFGFPQLVRFSWSTADKILQENAVQVEWEEEDDDAEADKSNTSITSFFQVEKKKKRSKHPFFVHRKLSNLETM
ncbi:ribonuclease H2 subunit A isoform X2 [Schistocerca serialis cubense]|uniref:ribonuclease H2 subunit A isoform X2 n=1 Tax=Schistocerca serialis cubense TaxID=2023355 RepID=UPI00214F5B31|nr:ribonuclease H2 subunit A isoform X2 [Schistocerca serialis cubense]